MLRQSPFPRFSHLPLAQAPQTHHTNHKQAHTAYEHGDGAAAHQLSEEGKRHAQAMDKYNKQAADFIFRENNAVGRVDGDTIDLHGLYVEEAEEMLEQRIRYAQAHGQGALHVYVPPLTPPAQSFPRLVLMSLVLDVISTLAQKEGDIRRLLVSEN